MLTWTGGRNDGSETGEEATYDESKLKSHKGARNSCVSLGLFDMCGVLGGDTRLGTTRHDHPDTG